MEHTLRAYDEELDAITAQLARMGGLAEAEVADSVRAIVKRDVKRSPTTCAGSWGR
jgi:phosphate transport system protein